VHNSVTQNLYSVQVAIYVTLHDII